MKPKAKQDALARDCRPPKGLTRRALALWQEILGAQIEPSDGSRVAMLRVALQALSTHDRAAEIIRRQGLVVLSRRGNFPHAHPLLRVQAQARREFTRLWVKLKLHAEWVDWGPWALR